jgi:hypothetical protein
MTNMEVIKHLTKTRQEMSMERQTVTGQDVIINNTVGGNIIKHTGKTPNLNYHSTSVHVRIHPLSSCVLLEA